MFFTPGPVEDAGCRMRVQVYLASLEAADIHGVIRPFMNRRFFKIAYRRGHTLEKIAWAVIRWLRRWVACLECLRYDVAYVYRECAPIGPPLFEWLLLRMGKPLVYDLDDAVFVPSGKEQLRGWLGAWLKWYDKVPWILRRCAHAVVGNRFLETYARSLAPRVTMLPTPEVPARFAQGAAASEGRPLTIGWIGTHSTAAYLLELADALREVATRVDVQVRVIGAGRQIHMPGLAVENMPWSLAEEAKLVQSFDIGVYPLSGSSFDQGKACYKAILYMAAGVPVVASRFGANCDIIQDGVNGFLASSREEWVSRLFQLVRQPDLRARLREAGRQTVAARYSVEVNAPRLINVLRSVGG